MRPTKDKIKSRYFYMTLCLLGLLLFLFWGNFNKQPGLKLPEYPRDREAFAKENGKGQKVLLLLIDNISVDDLQKDDLVNFKKIIGMGSFGLMNSRVSAVSSTDPLAIYASIGAGKKVADEDGTFQKDVGKIGSFVLINHLKTAFISETDHTIQPASSRYLIMDNKGTVPYDESGQDLLMEDAAFPGGIRTNPDKLLEKTTRVLNKAELVCVDFGDTRRVLQARDTLSQAAFEAARVKALKNADLFLGSLLNHVDLSNTAIMIISPNPSTGRNSWNNNYLTPVIYFKPGATGGVLFSDTTKRTGLVSYMDIAPTVLTGLGIQVNNKAFQGKAFLSIDFQNTLNTIQNELKSFIEIKRARYIVHGFYVLCLTSSLFALYYPRMRGRAPVNPKVTRFAGVTTAGIPFFSIFLPASIDFSHHYTMGGAIIGAALLSGLFFSTASRLTEKAFFIFGLSVWAFLTVDLFGHQSNLLKTPLGFADVFAGGRFYGINNDCMGILIGSAFYWVFYLVQNNPWHKTLQYGLIVSAGLLTTVSLMPLFGANVGGTIAALSTTILALLCFNGKPLTKRTLATTVALVFIIELVIASFDNGAGTQTHAGKALYAMTDLSTAVLLPEIIFSKLKLFLLMLIIPPWNLLLFAQAFIFYLLSKKRKMPIPAFYHVLVYCALITLLFNDTGIIAAAIIFTNVMLPLGVELNEKRMDQYEYGKRLTQRI